MELIAIKVISSKSVKLAVLTILGIILAAAIYITLSTIIINENEYRKYCWDYVNHDKHILSWTDAEVDKVLLNPGKQIAPGIKTINVNRLLLNLNGNQAVRVTFRTDMDTMLGPVVLYINPFTKRVIGFEFRE